MVMRFPLFQILLFALLFSSPAIALERGGASPEKDDSSFDVEAVDDSSDGILKMNERLSLTYRQVKLRSLRISTEGEGSLELQKTRLGQLVSIRPPATLRFLDESGEDVLTPFKISPRSTRGYSLQLSIRGPRVEQAGVVSCPRPRSAGTSRVAVGIKKCTVKIDKPADFKFTVTERSSPTAYIGRDTVAFIDPETGQRVTAEIRKIKGIYAVRVNGKELKDPTDLFNKELAASPTDFQSGNPDEESVAVVPKKSPAFTEVAQGGVGSDVGLVPQPSSRRVSRASTYTRINAIFFSLSGKDYSDSGISRIFREVSDGVEFSLPKGSKEVGPVVVLGKSDGSGGMIQVAKLTLGAAPSKIKLSYPSGTGRSFRCFSKSERKEKGEFVESLEYPVLVKDWDRIPIIGKMCLFGPPIGFADYVSPAKGYVTPMAPFVP